MRNLEQPGSFSRRAFALIHPYWSRSGERGIAWALLVTIIGISLGLVYLNVQYNYWNRNFFNALELKDWQAFWRLIPYFFGLSALTVTGGALQAYLTQMLQMRWRIWMTREYLDAWLAGQNYYHLEHDPRGTDNPDQRIAEDLKLLTTSTLDLALGFLHNAVTLATFVAILWSVSGSLAVPFVGGDWAIPGDLVWAALLYAGVGSALTYIVGRPLIGLRFQQERLEADMRYGLMRTREHAEGIALYRGEPAERAQIEERIGGLKSNWWQIMAATLKLNSLSSVYTQIGILFPYFIAAPLYFSGTLPLGGLTQIAGAFDTVRNALSWFVYNYQSLASWKASVDRLLTFQTALAAPSRTAENTAITRREHGSDAVTVKQLSLALPSGRPLLAAVDLDITRGEKIMLSGPPGRGKSTLFRALAGIWPHGSGLISIPAVGRILFLPQKPYLPIGTLASVVAYPSLVTDFPEERIRSVLHRVGLADLVDRLDQQGTWGQILSGGEQQKLTIARALLNAPDWLFLDEATAALDEASEAALYGALIASLPSTAIVSISHRQQLTRFHTRHLLVDGQGRLVPA